MRVKCLHIFICCIAVIVILFPMGHQYAQSVYITNLPSVENNLLVSKIIVLPGNQDDWKHASAIIERVSGLPEGLLQSLIAKKIKIKLFTGSLTDQAEAAHLKGIKPRGYNTKSWDDVPGMGGGKTVLVKIGYSDRGMDHNSINLELHELGHSVDQIVLDDISKTNYFQSIWKKEVENLFPNQSYFINYPEEYFAEAFAMFYFDSESRAELSTKAPLTYQYIESIEKCGYV